VRTGGHLTGLTVAEDSGTTSLGLGGLAYGPGGGADEASQSLTYTVTSLPPSSLGQVKLADGTAVTAATYTLAQIQGMRFATATNANGTGTFSFAVKDNGGGTDTLVQTLRITVTPVNDAPVRTTGTVSDLTVSEDSGSTSLALGGLGYGPGGAADEATQSLTYTVTALPPSSLGLVTLADGTAVSTGSYTLAQIQGMRFATAADANGTGTFSFAVKDNGGGTDTLAQSLHITVTAVNDAPVITSNGGQRTANVSVPENTTAVTVLSATDVDTARSNLVFSITGGADAALFALDAATGRLSFLQAPDYEGPADANRDNIYQVVVQVSDGTLATQQALSVRVTDVNDIVAISTTVTPGSAAAPAAASSAAPDLARAPAPAPVSSVAPAASTVHEKAASVSLQDALGPTMATAIATFNSNPPSLANAPARLALTADSSHVLHTVVLDRAGLQLISSDPSAQLVLARLGIDSRGDALRLADLQRSLHSSGFAHQFDRMRESVREELHLDDAVTISAASVSLGLSLVYVVWLIRGGVLLGSYLSALPAWRLLDPLPVLSRVDDEEDEEEPLEGAERGGQHTLRGFG
jgi:hypothetical protein